MSAATVVNGTVVRHDSIVKANLVIEDDAPNSEEPVMSETSADRAMHERAMKLGARFSAEHRVPMGTTISVMLGGTAP